MTVDFVNEKYKLKNDCFDTKKYGGSKLKNYILKNLNLDYKMEVGLYGIKKPFECDGSLLAVATDLTSVAYYWVIFIFELTQLTFY